VTVEYFAYGSNMSEAVMSEKAPRHRYLGPARLDGYQLAFTRRSVKTGTGVADVVRAPGSSVWGVLYEVHRSDFEKLDRMEGHGWAYGRREVTVRLGSDGSAHNADTYMVLEKEPMAVHPAPEYLDLLIHAARERGLPEAYISSLISPEPRSS
jgi:gamma-glutamylcyclotransferase (GGCT)/AIG2-like uncharacterized protein YtfP